LRSTTVAPLPRTALDTLVPQTAGMGGVAMGRPGVHLMRVKFLTMATSPLSSMIFRPPGLATAGY
jgi:hypothetical protein